MHQSDRRRAGAVRKGYRLRLSRRHNFSLVTLMRIISAQVSHPLAMSPPKLTRQQTVY
jgi:hypothetical protein